MASRFLTAASVPAALTGAYLVLDPTPQPCRWTAMPSPATSRRCEPQRSARVGPSSIVLMQANANIDVFQFELGSAVLSWPAGRWRRSGPPRLDSS